MEGLEISVINLSEVLNDNENKRFDSEYFKKQFINFFKEVPDLNPLGSFVSEGYRVVYENTKIIEKEEAVANNYPYFLQATDLNTPFIKQDNLFYVNNEQWERYPKGRIKAGEILIEVKGKIDKVAIVPDDFPKRTLVTGSLFKLSVNKKISKHVLLSYLISKYGSAFKDRFKTNLLISYVSKPDLYRIPVPSFSNLFQQNIDRLFKIIFESKKESKNLYTKAENLLLQEIGLQDFEPSQEAVNIKSFSESFGSTGRIDAEYYQPKYDEIEDKLNAQDNFLLSDIFEIKTSPSPSNYLNEGVKVIKTKNIRIPSVDYDRISDFTKGDNVLLTEKKDLLFASMGVGSLGRVSYIFDEDEKATIDGTIKIFRTKEEFKNQNIEIPTLLFLTSKIGQEEIYKFIIGSTGIISISKESVENLIIPKLSKIKSIELTSLVHKSIDFKKQSDHLLEVAKKAVELAIEQNEEMALNYIKTETKE